MGLATQGGLGKALLWAAAISSIGIALAAIRYLIPGAPGGVPDVLDNPAAKVGVLTIHAGLGLVALAIGAFQFMRALRLRRPRLHRRLGQAYVACCLGAGVCGLALALGTTAGPVATAGFGLLAVFWLFTTFSAWRCAVNRDFVAHEAWMTRSFALTFAAVTLRVYLIPVGAFHIEFLPAYRFISFAAWIPNLMVAEWLNMRRRVAALAG